MKIFKIKFIVFLICLIPTLLFSQKFNETTIGELWNYVEWKVENVNYSGNPFDLVARVSFIHKESNEIKTTEMFFDENNTWKFRFTGTQLGVWNFYTSSKNKQLDGLKGTVIIENNTRLRATGFLTNIGNKFAVQTSPDSAKGILFNVYMNKTKPEYSFRYGTQNDFTNYAIEAKNNGCTTIFSTVVGNSWFNYPTISTSEGKKRDPDPKTFRKLEIMIDVAQKEGVNLHIWAWGDEDRHQTPKYVGGINGKEDKRLQRYIAARLGPLPGWSMGYGFDLHEWTNPNEVSEWAGFMDSHMGWKHLLAARGMKLPLTSVINSYDGFGRAEASLFTSVHGPKNYEEVLEDINGDKTVPHLYEERHSYNRQDNVSSSSNNSWDLDMDKTRRLMWWEAMAGGMGGWFGFYEPTSPAFGGVPYPNPEQLKTHRKFWVEKNRFLYDFVHEEPINNVYILKSKKSNSVVLYKEETDTIEFDFNQYNSQRIIAVDTKLDYNEIQIDNNLIVNSTWLAPYKSDWIVAIGSFKNYIYHSVKSVSTPNYIQLNLFSASYFDSTISLHWETTSEQNLKGFLVEAFLENGSSSWEPVGFISIGRNSNLQSKYNFTNIFSLKNRDVNFRLKVFFADNSVLYSNTIRVERKQIINYLVELNAFKFSKDKDGINLIWQTAKESELEKFIIERTTNLSVPWENISTVEANNSSVNTDYNFLDTVALFGTTYMYRLQMLFSNNSTDYSEVITVPENSTSPNNIDLSDFKISKVDKGINLSWKTNNENNFDKFIVESSITNNKWEIIGTILTLDSSKTNNSYSFLDENQKTNNYLQYRLKIFFNDGTFYYSTILSFNNTPTDFVLNQNYPNPFNTSTTISFTLDEDTNVNLSIYNSLGQLVKSIVDKPLIAGYYSYEFNASNFSSGIYYYRITSTKHSDIKKMIYLK